MTVKELIEVIKRRKEWQDVVDIEMYRFVGKRKSFHTDCVKFIDEYGERYADCEVVDYSVMDCEEMNRTIYANSCEYAEEIYNEEDKLLAIAIADEEDEDDE